MRHREYVQSLLSLTVLTLVLSGCYAPTAGNIGSVGESNMSICGNGVLESNELCDGDCPLACDDQQVCTVDQLEGDEAACDAQCTYTAIESCGADDGCCPMGCNANTDSDCAATCGNGTIEDGEACDGNCPVEGSCDDYNACTHAILTGSAATCGATCSFLPILYCTSNDGCCPDGCTAMVDTDCAAICGNGIIEPGETCDGNCPNATSCNDGIACSAELFTGNSSSCDSSCTYSDIEVCNSGDGCCPSGCDSTSDADCSAACGNGIVEEGETCDGNCPTVESCSGTDVCSTWHVYGSANTCSAVCAQTDITACTDDDGCCPTSCNAGNDNECDATCGNSIVEPGETCDANCPSLADCSDSNACTTDALLGSVISCSAMCSHEIVDSCTDGDGCCPSGCNSSDDTDCAADSTDVLVASLRQDTPAAAVLDWNAAPGPINKIMVVIAAGRVAPGTCLGGEVHAVTDGQPVMLSALNPDSDYALRLCAVRSNASLSPGDTLVFRTIPSGSGYLNALHPHFGDTTTFPTASTTSWGWSTEFAHNARVITRFGHSANGAMTSNTPIASHSGVIFTCHVSLHRTTYLNASSDGGESWDSVLVYEHDDAQSFDGHNTCSLGVDSDGYVHIAYDMHSSPLRYRKSLVPLDIHQMSAPLPMTGVAESQVTYPAFRNAPNGDLIFSMRGFFASNASNGKWVDVKRYDTQSKTWSELWTPLLAGEETPGISGRYMNNFVWDASGDLHVSWVHRVLEDDTSWWARWNQDVSYARYTATSPSWWRSDGTAQTLPISRDSADIVWETQRTHGLSNSDAAAVVDSTGAYHLLFIARQGTMEKREIMHMRLDGTVWTGPNPVTDFKLPRLSVCDYGGYTPEPQPCDREIQRPTLIMGDDDRLDVFVSIPLVAETSVTHSSPPARLYWLHSLDRGDSWSTAREVMLPSGWLMGQFTYERDLRREQGIARLLMQTQSGAYGPTIMLEGRHVPDLVDMTESAATFVGSASSAEKSLHLARPADQFVTHYDFESVTNGVTPSIWGDGFDGALAPSGSGPTLVAANAALGKAMDFDGVDDHVVVADEIHLTLKNTLTLQAWVRPTEHRMATVLDKGGSPGNREYRIRLFSAAGDNFSNSQLQVLIGDRTGNWGLVWYPDADIPLNAWTHIAVVWKEASVTLSINGVAVGSQVYEMLPQGQTAAPRQTMNGRGPLLIGAASTNTSTSDFFKGQIDAVSVSSKVLDPSDFSYPIPYNRNDHLKFAPSGHYVSPMIAWRPHSGSYQTLSVNLAAHGGHARAVIETSDDKFVTTAQRYTATLSDGLNPLPLGDMLRRFGYIRVRLELETSVSMSSPTVSRIKVISAP